MRRAPGEGSGARRRAVVEHGRATHDTSDAPHVECTQQHTSCLEDKLCGRWAEAQRGDLLRESTETEKSAPVAVESRRRARRIEERHEKETSCTIFWA